MVLQQKIGAVSYIFADTSPGNDWDEEAASAPTVSIMILSGPSTNTNKLTLVQNAQALGIKVIGYAYTSYGLRTLSEVKADIDTFYSYYDVDGILLDQTDNTGAYLSYYTELYQYIKAKPGGGIVALNPGSKTVEAYAAIADHIMVAETNATNYRNRTPQLWEYNYPSSKFWHVIHSCTLAELHEMVVLSRQRNAGLLFVTDDLMPNPYDVIPTFWNQFVAEVQLANQGGVAEPTYPVPPEEPENPGPGDYGTHMPDPGGDDSLGMGGVTATTSDPPIADSPYLPARTTGGYTWKICPFSTAYNKFWMKSIDYTLTSSMRTVGHRAIRKFPTMELENVGVPGDIDPPQKLYGTSNNIAYVKSILGLPEVEEAHWPDGHPANHATEHTTTEGKMRYHERGWMCFDNACYHYILLGRRYHEI